MKHAMLRTTVYFQEEVSRALRVKAAVTRRSISDLVNDAVLLSLREDQEDLEAFDLRAAESAMTYEDLLKDLKAHGKL